MKKSKAVREWIDKAEEDYKSLVVLRKRRLWNASCFHAQQCAEKYLKGVLTLYRVTFPKTHDLLELLDLLLHKLPEADSCRDNLRALNRYSVLIRYPGEKASIQDEVEAFGAVTGVRNFFRKILRPV